MNIYADNAAFKPLLPEVKKFIHDFIETDFRNPSAIYSNGRSTRRLIEQAREQVAKAIGADVDEIYFTSGATEGINWFCNNLKPIHTTTIEHKAVMRNADYFIPVSKTGIIDLDAFTNECPRHGNVIVGWVNNEIGTIQPIKEIVAICHKNNSRILIDATQAIGHIPIDVHELDIDFLVGSFGKLGGLSGSGFLYMRKGMRLEPMIKGGSQERGLRASTENVLGILAGAIAIKEATQNVESKMSAIKQNRDKIISELLTIPNSHINGDINNRVAGNINITFDGVDAESLVMNLDLDGIQVSAGSACNSISLEPSHVLKAIGLDDNAAHATVRITIEELSSTEIDYLVNCIKKRINFLRKF